VRRLARLLRRVVRAEHGYSIMELVTVVAILGTILGALTGLFVSGSNAQIDQNRRFQAQIAATVALDRLRKDAHCASAVTPTGASSSVTLTLPTACQGGGGTINWCTQSFASGRYRLYRTTGATACDANCLPVSLTETATDRCPRYADYLTVANAFTYYVPVQDTSLAKLHVDLTINLIPAKAVYSYPLSDDIVLRNSLRG
jgi:type II secretory pathway pseudopilin PulG